MYSLLVYLHVAAVFVFLVQHAAEIYVTYKLRQQKDPEKVFAVYDFIPANNSRNLRITYLVILLTGAIAGFISPWWRQGWMWTALGVMLLLWYIMYRIGGPVYYEAVDQITERALKNKDDEASIEQFRQELGARREPEIMMGTSIIGMGIILWLMMFKPF